MLLCSIKSPELTLVSRGRTACVFQDGGVERAEEDKVCGVGCRIWEPRPLQNLPVGLCIMAPLSYSRLNSSAKLDRAHNCRRFLHHLALIYIQTPLVNTKL